VLSATFRKARLLRATYASRCCYCYLLLSTYYLRPPGIDCYVQPMPVAAATATCYLLLTTYALQGSTATCNLSQSLLLLLLTTFYLLLTPSRDRLLRAT